MKEKSKKTAVDFLFAEYVDDSFIITIEALTQAKEIERKQSQEYAEFCVHCDRNNLPLLDFEGFINLK